MYPRVLIVDDDPLACRSMGEALAQSGFRVAAVHDGPAALQSVAQAGAPELVVLDLVLPGMNGLDVLRALRADSRAADAAVMVVTALQDRSNLLNALRLGADDFLFKPLDTAELALRSRNMVDRRGGARGPDLHARVDLAVLFADVRGFTPLTEKIDPETGVTILNGLFDTLDRAIEGQGGYVDKFIGDGLMAFFRAGPPEEDAQRACRAALEMQRFAARFAAESLSLAQHAAHFGIGVGIACGEAVVGAVGTQRKRSLTAIGDPVNLAARLQALADAGEIVVDHDVARRVGEAASLSEPREVVVKGKERPRVVYKLQGLLGVR